MYTSSLNPPRQSQVGIFVLLLIAHVGGLAWVFAASHRTPPLETERLLVSIIEAPQLVPAVQVPEPPAPAPVIKPPPRPPEPVREVRDPDPPPPQPIAPREMQPPPPPVKVEPVPVPKPVPQPEPERVAVVAEPVLTPPPVPQAPPMPVHVEPAPIQQAVAPPAPSTPPPPVVPIVEARYDAAYLDNPKPSYPVIARRQGLQGRVLLRVLVSSAGLPQKVELKQTSGSNALDRSALDAVSQWRFVPARQGEKAVDAWIVVPIIFTLKG